MRKIYLALDSIAPDPQQYKPWNPVYHPAHLIIVEFEVPDDMVIGGEIDIKNLYYKDALIVKPEAVAYICRAHNMVVRKLLEGD